MKPLQGERSVFSKPVCATIEGAFSFVAGCWFGNPGHPGLQTWVEGVSSADLLREEKHAEAHSLALGLLDLVFTKHKQAQLH